jgi:hypothetical protein
VAKSCFRSRREPEHRSSIQIPVLPKRPAGGQYSPYKTA